MRLAALRHTRRADLATAGALVDLPFLAGLAVGVALGVAIVAVCVWALS